jgi:hypothetical protein
MVTRYTEQGTDIIPWIRLLAHPLRPLLEVDPGRGSIPPDAPYYAFEFLPKLFMGFWGWMGQPSILLPASAYALLAVATVLACAGLLRRLRNPAPASEEERRRLTARRLMAAGIVLMCLPIIYGPAVAGRNLWYGRWLFAMISPILIGFVLGLREIGLAARRSPHRVSLALAAAAASAGVLWLTGPGEWLRAGIVANHYGDSKRLVATVGDAIGVLAIAAAAIELAARVPAPRFKLPAVPTLLVAAGAANMIVLVAFLRPLYAPLEVNDYIALISKYVASRDLARAADLHASAVRSYPRSREIRRLADDTPRLLLGGASASSRALLWDRIARGKGFDDRDALLTLAAEARDGDPHWRDSKALNAALDEAARQPDLLEPVMLVRLAVNGGAAARDASRAPIEAGRGRRLSLPVRNGELMIEGVTTHSAAGGGTQLILYFRPHIDASSRRLMMRAFPRGSPEYIDLWPTIAPALWQPGTLAWATFELPPGAFDAYVGVSIGNDLGPGAPIGTVP